MSRKAVALGLAIAMVTAPLAASEIEAPGPQGPLRGTLLEPASQDREAPVVLIVPGSGPTDRDGNNPLGVAASPYRLLAEALAERGIASVRIDKRGMFASAGAVPDANAVSIADYADDVEAWSKAIERQTDTRCVWLLGHSEGGLVVLAAAARGTIPLCGLILVATPGRRAGDVLRAQIRANPANAPFLDQALSAIASLEEGDEVETETLHPALQPLFPAAIQGYLRDLFALDPEALAARVDLPALVIQGDEDIQVGAADAERLARALGRGRLVRLSGVNHVLKQVVPGDHADNLAAYGDPGRPLAAGIVEAIADFVTAAR